MYSTYCIQYTLYRVLKHEKSKTHTYKYVVKYSTGIIKLIILFLILFFDDL